MPYSRTGGREAPIDGKKYIRKDADWEELLISDTGVQIDTSPAHEEVPEVEPAVTYVWDGYGLDGTFFTPGDFGVTDTTLKLNIVDSNGESFSLADHSELTIFGEQGTVEVTIEYDPEDVITTNGASPYESVVILNSTGPMGGLSDEFHDIYLTIGGGYIEDVEPVDQWIVEYNPENEEFQVAPHNTPQDTGPGISYKGDYKYPGLNKYYFDKGIPDIVGDPLSKGWYLDSWLDGSDPIDVLAIHGGLEEEGAFNSSFTFDITTYEGGVFGVEYLVSSEENYDFLRIWIDGVNAFEASGDTDVEYFETTLSEGVHTIQIQYEKDESYYDYEDSAAIYSITVNGPVSYSSGDVVDNKGIRYLSIVDGNESDIDDRSRWIEWTLSPSNVVSELSGGGVITTSNVEFTDSDTYILPNAGDFIEGYSIRVSISNKGELNTPTLNTQGGDTIEYSLGSDTGIYFDTGAVDMTLVSNGVDTWRF